MEFNVDVDFFLIRFSRERRMKGKVCLSTLYYAAYTHISAYPN